MSRKIPVATATAVLAAPRGIRAKGSRKIVFIDIARADIEANQSGRVNPAAKAQMVLIINC